MGSDKGKNEKSRILVGSGFLRSADSTLAVGSELRIAIKARRFVGLDAFVRSCAAIDRRASRKPQSQSSDQHQKVLVHVTLLKHFVSLVSKTRPQGLTVNRSSSLIVAETGVLSLARH